MKKEVEFKSDGLILRGTLFTPDGKEEFGGIVLMHGLGSNHENYLPICEALLEKGIASLAFDFRGCGKSEGDLEESSVNDEVTDGQAALEFLLSQKGIKSQSIGLVGASMGGHVAATLAGRNPNIISLILRAPVAVPEELVNLPKKERTGRDWIKDKNQWTTSPALKAIENFKNFLLIVASENDETIPFEMLEEYKKRSGARFSEIQILKGAAHRLGTPDSPEREDLKKMVVTWFTRES